MIVRFRTSGGRACPHTLGDGELEPKIDSFTIKAISPAGFECLLCLRDKDGKSLMTRAMAALNLRTHLSKELFQDTHGRSKAIFETSAFRTVDAFE